MKKKKKKTGMILIDVVLIAAACAGIFFLISAKRQKKDYSEFQSVIQTEWEKSLSKDAPDFLKKLNSSSSFSVKSVYESDSGFYTVTLSVTSPDINESLVRFQEEAAEQSLSADEINASISSLIEKAQPKTTEQPVYVIEAENKNYYVRFSEEFIDAMSGYAYTNARNAISSESALTAEEDN